LRHNVGAECNISVGKSVIYAKGGYDGIVHVMPFTCTPETIAQSILTKLSRDFDIPILTLIIDENTQAVGLQTRLEAFSESLHSKKFSKSYQKIL
jgi:predicted nucleotide-binding protein (sugar kinase/HSP70/actin superfamily)